jgi:hypothetical protein
VARGLKVSIKIDGLPAAMRRVRALPDDALSKVLDASWELSQDLAKTTRALARANGPQAALLAATVATGEGILPSVTVGGTIKVGRNKKPAYKVLFGSEFGAVFLKQFKPRNTGGYWFYPSVDAMRGEFNAKWNDAAQRACDEFGGL